MKDKPRIVFDLDGVIHSYTSGWLGYNIIPDPPVDGIKELIDTLKNNYEIAIQSSRCIDSLGLNAVQNYLHKHNIHFDTIWTEKPPAVIYIDDRAICFDGNPAHLLEQIKHFKPWTEKDNTKQTCPFCHKNKIKIQTKTRKGTEYGKNYVTAYAVCNCCHARGPVVSTLIDRSCSDKSIIEHLKEQALDLWDIRR